MEQGEAETSYAILDGDGGMLRRLLARAGQPGAKRLILGVWFTTWLPLLLLSLLGGVAWGDRVAVPFLPDFATHVLYLLVVPLLLFPERFIAQPLQHAAEEFVRAGLITEESLPRYQQIIRGSRRLTRAILPEAVLLALVVAAALLRVKQPDQPGLTSWRSPEAGTTALNAAGWWHFYVGLSLYRFLLLRLLWWYLIWAALLFRTARIRLWLVPSHPDRAGGLAFVGIAHTSFAPLVMIIMVGSSCLLAERILFGGETLASLQREILGLPVFMLLLLLLPLTVFAPRLIAARRGGFVSFGALASSYVESFEKKWQRRNDLPGEQLLGCPDISSLADLGTSFRVIEEMRPFPMDARSLLGLCAAVLLPLAPLLLTRYTPAEILGVLRVLARG